MNKVEIKAIHQKENIALWLAAIIGALGVIILYIQQYNFPHWFPDISFTLLGEAFTIPIVIFVYAIVLVIMEIVLLTLLNIWYAYAIAVSTRFLFYYNKIFIDKRNLLLDIGSKKRTNKYLLTVLILCSASTKKQCWPEIFSLYYKQLPIICCLTQILE